jgi:hypothetical protein
MKIHWLLVAFLPGISLPLCGLQGSTPQAALEEIATTNKPEVIARHLPEPVQKSIDVLPKLQKEQFMNQLLTMKASQLGGLTVRPAHDGAGWEILDEDGKSKGKVTLANAFISGLDAMLPLQINSPDGSMNFIVTMHLEGDDWRIDDFGPWEKTDLGLNKLLHEPSEVEKNEAAAQETLQAIRSALVQYAERSPRIGFPSGLRALTLPNDEPIARKFAALRPPLLDESFAADPLIKDGYLFRYFQTEVGSGELGDPGEFEITATPLEPGKTGIKSYVANQNGVHAADEPAATQGGLFRDLVIIR